LSIIYKRFVYSFFTIPQKEMPVKKAYQASGFIFEVVDFLTEEAA
jgi:hypothetical protein